MRLLFDQNLSSELVSLLTDLFPGSQHVRPLNLHQADDEVVWAYAAAQGMTIVSKDSDFHQLSFLRGHPPKVIWLRVGNAPTARVAALLREQYAVVQAFDSKPESSFLALG